MSCGDFLTMATGLSDRICSQPISSRETKTPSPFPGDVLITKASSVVIVILAVIGNSRISMNRSNNVIIYCEVIQQDEKMGTMEHVLLYI